MNTLSKFQPFAGTYTNIARTLPSCLMYASIIALSLVHTSSFLEAAPNSDPLPRYFIHYQRLHLDCFQSQEISRRLREPHFLAQDISDHHATESLYRIAVGPADRFGQMDSQLARRRRHHPLPALPQAWRSSCTTLAR